MRKTILVFAICAVSAAGAVAQELDRYERYRQSPAVRAHYSDVELHLDTPALAEGRHDFTSQQELEDFVAGVTASSRRITAGSLGKSQQGREIPYLVATAEGLSDTVAIAKLGRPIVWLIGLQHGNEPAGGEAMLAVASALARGELASLTERVTVVIVPRANPDGAAASRRTTANGADPNRDHLLLLLPETQALHRLMAVLPPDVVLDCHEFTVANRWMAKFGAIQAVDALLLSATHPMVSRDIVRLSDTVFRPRIEDALKAQGLSTFDYYTTALDTADKTVSMGGNAPGAARNTFGLAHAVSFLIESRGVGIDHEGFQRRVATHYLAAKAVLETAAEHAAELRTTIGASRHNAAQDTTDIVVAHKVVAHPLTLPLLDPASGGPRPTEVIFRDSRIVMPMTVRTRPAGYLLLDASPAAIAALRLNSVTLCHVAQAADIEADAFVVRERAKVDREAINPDQAIKVELSRRTVRVPEGASYVPAAQPAGALLALALEPDSAGSLAGAGLVTSPPGTDELAVYRLRAEPKLAPADLGDPELCK